MINFMAIGSSRPVTPTRNSEPAFRKTPILSTPANTIITAPTTLTVCVYRRW